MINQNTKPYTWEEVREFLVEKLRKTKSIMTFGTLGSCNVEHDVDFIITKKPGSKTSSFYSEIHQIFDSLDNYLNNKYNARLFRFAHSGEQFLVENLSTNKADLFFHVMIYLSMPQIEADWKNSLLRDVSIRDILLKDYKCLHGDLSMLFSKKFQKESHYDSLYLYLYLYDKFSAHYPDQLLIRAMNHYNDYCLRKVLKLTPFVAKNKKQARKYFYKLCNIIDKLDKRRPIIPKKQQRIITININLNTSEKSQIIL